MSYNPSAPPFDQGARPSEYQIGAGAPANQQYLQSQEGVQGGTPTGAPPQHQYGAPGSYAPPPQNYSPGQSQQHYPPPPAQAQQQHQQGSIPTGQHGQGIAGQEEQHYPLPPAQHVEGASVAGQSEQSYPPPPTQHAQGDPVAVQPLQQYPPPPAASQPGPGLSQPPGQNSQQNYPPPPTTMATASGAYPVPPKRNSTNFGDDDPSNPIHYTRDPHKLVAYLVPFPKPSIKNVDLARIPDRFLIYTPPPPPLSAPKEGEKEDKLHKVQRKWQEEVRAAKTSDAKVASWKGVKSRATKGISYVMSKTTSSNLDFVNRIPGEKADIHDKHSEDGVAESDTTKKTVGLEELVLVYPASFGAPPDQVRAEFINTIMRTKSKAQRDAIIATGLLPVSGAIDLLATFVWPFGGLLEIDGVWAYSSIRGAKTARSVTKRLSSSTNSGNLTPQTEEQEMVGDKLRLNFTQSLRLEVLQRYLITRCRDYDHKLFPNTEVAPTEGEVLAAIGWAPSTSGHPDKNWEDEQWETEEVKDDMRSTLGKAAKEWEKWCKAFSKDPEKALKQ